MSFPVQWPGEAAERLQVAAILSRSLPPPSELRSRRDMSPASRPSVHRSRCHGPALIRRGPRRRRCPTLRAPERGRRRWRWLHPALVRLRSLRRRPTGLLMPAVRSRRSGLRTHRRGWLRRAGRREFVGTLLTPVASFGLVSALVRCPTVAKKWLLASAVDLRMVGGSADGRGRTRLPVAPAAATAPKPTSSTSCSRPQQVKPFGVD